MPVEPCPLPGPPSLSSVPASSVANKSATLGTGHKLGGGAAAGAAGPSGAGAVDDSPEARRARMVAAAEARFNKA